MLRLSVSGCDTQDAINVTLDGQQIPWKTSNHLDRSFFEYISNQRLKQGQHVLQIEEISKNRTAPRILCNVRLHEYMNDELFKFSNDYVNAYPMYNGMFQEGYRPQVCIDF